ncbi:hypothetical protein GDO86_013317 [Hymenochirus boettgeri]|uniref:Calcium homeostasis modulator 3 n=1 Tax=Hymenochirus boettgeri TaxID=247094 RepID=A0A8T2ITN9_9PIPI|nr:hypothetical protein GDO86_013317 [Hymenochirus boettgeri]
MERFKMIFQYFQSNSESVMNGICGILALASVKIYNTLEFNCPCLPTYNMAYGMGIMFVPPLALFLCGLIVNRHLALMIEEWRRPTGRRKKDLAIVKYMFSSVLTRAMVAPVVWILTTLLDGNCFVCAFSSSVDSEKFPGFANNSYSETLMLLYKVPCKEDISMRNNPARKAVSRYLKCWSQAIGWGILLLLIVMAFLARSLKPFFDQSNFLQTRYWSNYIDIEQKIFDETCCEHARDFAHKCILHFFDSMHNEMKAAHFTIKKKEEEEDHLHGITDHEQVNQLLKTWYQSKPPLCINHATLRQNVKAKNNTESNTDKETDV